MIKILLSILFLLAFTCCKDRSTKYENLELPSNIEVNNVILSIFEQDTNYDFIEHFTSIELPKTTIDFRTKQKAAKHVKPLVMPNYEIDVNSLIGYGITNEELLKNSDSLYFAYQNQYSKKVHVDMALFRAYRILTIDSIKKYYSQKHFYYIEFGAPIFTANKQYAFLESNIICSGLCGEGRAYILEKIKGRWILRKSIIIWVG